MQTCSCDDEFDIGLVDYNSYYEAVEFQMRFPLKILFMFGINPFMENNKL